MKTKTSFLCPVLASAVLLAALGLQSACATTSAKSAGPGEQQPAAERAIPRAVEHGLTGDQRAAITATSLVGTAAQAVTISTLDGDTIDLASYYGNQPVYLEFWATWCIPCREQMPHLEAMHRAHGSDIAVLAVNMGFNDDMAAVRGFRDEHDLTMPIVIDDGRLAAAFDVRVTPQHVLIDRHGRVAYVGHSVTQKLDETITALAGGGSGPRPRLAGEATKPAKAAGREPGLAGADGRPRVLLFTTSWCEWYLAKSRPNMVRECARARQDVSALYRSHGEGAQFQAIFGRVWSGEAEMREYAAKHGLRLPLHLDASGKIFRRYDIRRVPTVIVLDGDGAVALRVEGHDGDLAESLATALDGTR